MLPTQQKKTLQNKKTTRKIIGFIHFLTFL